MASFALGGPIAVVLASLLGYALAAAGLRPVEAIRRRAAGRLLARDGEPLPLPAANDEIRRLAKTLNEMLDRLRRSYEREASFVADASHELRTPIAVIKTELETALRHMDRRYPDADARDALVAAVEECDHLGQLAEDLLVVARTGDGRIPLQPRTLCAAEVLDRRAQPFRRSCARARPSDQGRRRPEDLLVHADETRLRQALGNLIDNALRYGAGPITLRASAGEGEVRLDIADGGDGFAPEISARAFERFARGDAARTRGGTGLGLAIVRAIAEAHGGRAEIVTGTAGATVRIALPSAIGASGASKRALLASQPLSTHVGGDSK